MSDDQLELLGVADCVSGDAAIMSADGRYRYQLTRRLVGGGDKTVLFGMLNPSTADATKDDPTVTRCRGFATRLGAGWLKIVNLYAYRATDPRELLLVDETEAIGPDNDAFIRAAFDSLGPDDVAIAAWGANASVRRAQSVGLLAESRGVALQCLGTTMSGQPRHPLYLRSAADLIPWSVRLWMQGSRNGGHHG